MAMTKQFVKTQWNNDREPAITAEQLNRMEKGIDVNDTRIVELDKTVTANKNAGDKSLAEVNKTLLKHTEDITAVNNELTSQSKAIGELADKKITKFYASSQGYTTLSDSDDGKMQDMMLYGKSEQKQYSGKNLLNLRLGKSGTGGGVTFTRNEDGSYKMKGTATEISGNVWFLGGYYTQVTDANTLFTLEPGTYIIKECTLFSATNKFLDTVTLTKSLKITGVRNPYMNVGTAYDTTIYPRILAGDTDTGWEPYVGGIPSPNPDYPQEIKSVVEPVVKVTGKNLYYMDYEDYSQTYNNVKITSTKFGYSLSGTFPDTGAYTLVKRCITLLPGKYKMLLKNISALTIALSKRDYKKIASIPKGKIETTFTLNEKTEVCLTLGYTNITVNETNEIMLTNNLETTAYEPYTAQSVPLTSITLNAIPVSSGGNVTIDGQQYISDYVDVERGKIIRKIREMILTGSENWSVEADGKTESHRMFTDVSKNYATIVHLPSSIIGAICSHFIETSSYDTWNATQKNAFSFSANSISLHVRKKGIFTVDELKSWLSKNNTKIYYPLATPTEESLSDELAEKLKALQTYYSQTNLFITSNQLDGYAIFNYPISLANGWNYVKQQIGDTRDYIYDMDLQMAQAYVNSEYAVALTELEV